MSEYEENLYSKLDNGEITKFEFNQKMGDYKEERYFKTIKEFAYEYNNELIPVKVPLYEKCAWVDADSIL